MKLTQRFVNRYARYAALRNTLDKWLSEARSHLLEQLAIRPCPARGPWLLQLTEAAPSVAWKEEFRSYLEADGRTALEIELLFAKIAAEPRDKVARIVTRPNPDYKSAMPRIALPKV